MNAPGLNLGKIMLRLANTLGVASTDGDGALALPEDVALIGELKEAVQDGIDLMRLEYPGWRCLRPPLDMPLPLAGDSAANIESDPTRLMLPWYAIGTLAATWNWRDTARRSGQTILCEHHRVEDLKALGTTGPPTLIAIVPGSQPGSWEARIAPTPDQDYTLFGDISLFAFQPTELFHRSPFGAVHDQTVVAAAKYCKIRDNETDKRRDTFEATYRGLLASSKQMDEMLGTPRSLGTIRDPGTQTSGELNRRQGGVTHYNGVQIN